MLQSVHLFFPLFVVSTELRGAIRSLPKVTIHNMRAPV